MSNELTLLLIQCKKGNQKAQIKLYDLFCKAMYAIACRYLKNDEEAKDAMQDGFLKAFINLENYTDQTTFGSWLKRIIIHQCIDVLKKKKLDTVSLEKYPLEIAAETNWNFEVKMTKEMILEAIEKLPQKYELVVKLYLIEGYDHSEISEILQIPVKTSRTQLRRGKLALQKTLKTQRYGA
ncbi:MULTISPECIES: RNA polymerase sigma factor [unclassified Polaribacter]|uniref:RNA polymerase sigma factor n=1 Tax=unclassified Polaribacter TaxID=196858 RepID=UPI0011BE8D0F|nr:MULTISPECIES: RNA polymerase sigma factor [unclassified Polaribacter]TXD53485.1 RNA polymerase sigma factor [Polaribacter sp. IC063]TXD57724.1 RNA polymerase sigma factor [Polaribacter sp. IC066]